MTLRPIQLIPGHQVVRSARAAELTQQRLHNSGLPGMRAAELAIRAEFGPPDTEKRPELPCHCRRDGKWLCDDHAPRMDGPRAMQEGKS